MQTSFFLRNPRMQNTFPRILLLLLLLTILLPLVACRPPHQLREEQEIRKKLANLKTRLVNLVSEQFPQATDEERDTILRMLVRKMKKRIQRNFLRSSVTKEDILARMLRWDFPSGPISMQPYLPRHSIYWIYQLNIYFFVFCLHYTLFLPRISSFSHRFCSRRVQKRINKLTKLEDA